MYIKIFVQSNTNGDSEALKDIKFIKAIWNTYFTQVGITVDTHLL